jgi:enterochelin esterase-like enzyme
VEPNSPLLIGLLFAAGAGGVVLVARVRRWMWRAPLVPLAVAFSALAGMAVVNDYYGYYQTWSQLYSDFTGSYARYTTTATGHRGPDAPAHGQVRQLRLTGISSGISRNGFVYLPPQYSERQFAATRFPVVELIPGSPGRPTDYLVHLGLPHLMNELIARHQLGPMIVVLPQTNAGNRYEECVDAPGVADDTYVTADVRRDVLARFRASGDPAQWGIAGYSSGGYCAANLALRHRSWFGAAGIIDGYFRPTDGPAADALGHNPAAEQANDPIRAARALDRDSRPLPALWVSAGTGVAADLAGARAFMASLHGVEQVQFVEQRNAGHNFYAWRPLFPRLLAWMWAELAPPDLRVQFPLSGPVHGDVLHRHGDSRTVGKLTERVHM